VWPDLATFELLAREYPLVPVARTWNTDLETPVSVYLKLVGQGHGYLLESVEGGERIARYSFVGADPFRVVAAAPDEDAFALLRRHLAELRAPALNRLPGLEGLPDFTGGLVGYLGYDAVRALERLPDPPPEERDLPAAWWMAAGILAIFDHVKSQVYLVAALPGREGESAEDLYRRSAAVLDDAVARLQKPLPEESLRAAAPSTRAYRTDPLPDFPRDSFLAAVGRIQEYIRAGDAFQVVLSQRLRSPLRSHPFSLYRSLRRLNPSPYMFYLNFGPVQLAGASPEMLVRLERGRVITRPIAGTRPRGATPEEDRALERDLLSDPKELAEHAMLLDLGRNDVGRVSAYGTVQVTEAMRVERYSHVMHLVSEVTGELATGRDAVDALAACFPAGTLSGAPKVRAMQIIDELEPVRRGPYGGAVGYLGFAGGLDACIAIRTAVVQGGVAYIQAGAGIVADSQPEREYEECWNKAAALLRAAEQADAGADAGADAQAGADVRAERGEPIAAGD